MASTSDRNYENHPDYDNLPEAIKADITRKEYAWMPDELRNNLERDMTTPDYEED